MMFLPFIHNNLKNSFKVKTPTTIIIFPTTNPKQPTTSPTMDSTTNTQANTGNAAGQKEDYVDKGKLAFLPSQLSPPPG